MPRDGPQPRTIIYRRRRGCQGYSSLRIRIIRETDQPIAWVILGIDSCLSIVLDVGMPRKLRIEYPEAMYHVMSRRDRRAKIFLDDVEFTVHLNPVRAGKHQ